MSDTSQQTKGSYKQTLNLPRTGFAMKANLVQNEPASLKRWTAAKLYEQIRQRPHPRGRYVFHDGPPYANGSIHLGHLLNKVLKDIVVRTRTMAGYDCPYTPGWDCHGLPIEHKVMQERQQSEARPPEPDTADAEQNKADAQHDARLLQRMAVRRACRKYAEKYIKLQSAQMQRLLTLADYDRPYLTMDPAYEAAVLEVFADLVGKGLVYRDLKPVHWSIANQTALAEAELEYEDREDTSVYVLFQVQDATKLPASLNAPAGEPVHLMIWTTTPWTLPANLAVAMARGAEYSLFRYERGGSAQHVVMAEALHRQVLHAGGVGDDHKRLGTCSGAELADSGATYRHPFIDRDGVLVTADYVTLEDGTGLVHTAPGHGTEDYLTGKAHGLDIYCPVKADGTFDDTAPDWLRGVDVWTANGLVVQRLRDSGHLFHAHKFTHSYPHDWRSKTPVIFRATEQWFVAVDAPQELGAPNLRTLALNEIEKIDFYPEWGRNRMRGMLESRPDWCLSRQRAWGLPIPAFFGPEAGQYLLTAASVRAVADKVRQYGSDYWFKATPEELLGEYDAANDPDAPAWAAWAGGAARARLSGPRLTKGQDIFDVWFESGSSWNAALKRMQGDYPADLYLEGSDQHRGWFQLSLLPALGVTGQSPFRAVLTHGFMVDKDGRKMSKSVGNTLEVDELLKDFGADVCRWWVSSLNTDNDIKVDLAFFKVAGEEYRKVRNTLRFILGNLGDFDPASFLRRDQSETTPNINGWILSELYSLCKDVQDAYRTFRFRKAHELLFTFCNETLSSIYLAAAKDRLYCDRSDSYRRRQTQAALLKIAHDMCLLLAPIVPHTADEAWHVLYSENEPSVHLSMFPTDFPEDYGKIAIPGDADWGALMVAREVLMKEIESFRQSTGADNPLDLGMKISRQRVGLELLRIDPVDAADLLGISRIESKDSGSDEVLDLRAERRCNRCWKRDGTVKQRSDGGMLCDRCAEAVGAT